MAMTTDSEKPPTLATRPTTSTTLSGLPEGSPPLAPAPASLSALQRVPLEEIKQLMSVMADTLDSFGNMVGRVGSVEAKAGFSLGELSKRMASEGLLDEMVKRLTEEQLGLFFKVLVRLSTVGQLQLDTMSPERKIETGKSLQAAAADLQSLLTKLGP
jgi:hypothetical protein